MYLYINSNYGSITHYYHFFYGVFIPLVLIFVIFYFFLIRPQQKKVKDHKAMVEALKRGANKYILKRKLKDKYS